jgi:hypothetical protein
MNTEFTDSKDYEKIPLAEKENENQEALRSQRNTERKAILV